MTQEAAPKPVPQEAAQLLADKMRENPVLADQLREHQAEEVRLGNVETEWFKNPELEGVIGANAEESGAYGIRTTDREKVRLYNTMTGQPSDVLIYMVSKKLGNKRGDGKSWWTLNPDEAPEWALGTIICQLHPDHPDREWLDSIGLQGRTCAPMTGEHKSNITSDFELKQHMAKKHRVEHATIVMAQERDEKEEERRWQRTLMESVSGKSDGSISPELSGLLTEVANMLKSQNEEKPAKRGPGRPPKES